MSPAVRIGYLVDHPEALPGLERLFQSEWAAYSGTSSANSLLIREGWHLMEVVQYDGEAVSIYEKALSQTRAGDAFKAARA